VVVSRYYDDLTCLVNTDVLQRRQGVYNPPTCRARWRMSDAIRLPQICLYGILRDSFTDDISLTVKSDGLANKGHKRLFVRNAIKTAVERKQY
jgi:hypothetical protein